ncbi:TPA: hypothetical protein DF272_03090 [Candidatus Falkowbacteria bacterium]|nr:hypothetical protein [Candidatus Falkowbacteria bacterium]
MKIAQIVCTLPPYGGGIGVVAHNYAKELVRQGHEVVVFVPRNKKHLKTFSDDYTVKQLWSPLQLGHGAILPQLLWRLFKFDVVHIHFPFFGAAFFVQLAKRIRGPKMKLVLSYHMDVIGHGMKKRLFSLYNRLILKWSVKNADKIIVSSIDYIENSNLRGYYFEAKEKFVEIPFGVDRVFSPARKNPSLMEKYQIKPDNIVVGFVGGLDSAHYFKGVNNLITAVSKVADDKIKAMIVGAGNLKKRYEQQAADLGIGPRVIFTGYISDEALPEHYNLCDIFVLPSVDKSEAFGLVLLEAMACGKPLIASNLKGVRSVVVPGLNGLLIEPNNPQDLADKIKFFVSSPKLVQQFRLNGIETANQKYRWPKVVEKLVMEYKRIN